MTDQTQFERELTDRLQARAARTRVDLDHGRITGAPRPPRPAPERPTWAVAGAFAAVIALVVAGLALLIRTGDDEPAPADTFPPVLPAPATTAPPPPDYGVLDDTEGPTIDDHWHVAYGFFLCGQWFQLQGNLEEQDAQGNFVNERFLSNGLHSHDDGVIHVHPYGDGGAGENATLRTFLANRPQDDVAGGADGQQRDDIVRGLVTELPNEQQSLVKLAFYEGLSHSQIAERTGIPLGTVKSRLRLAFTRLRRGLEAAGVEESR